MNYERENKILIVNDLPEQLRFFCTLFADAGYHVSTANDGREGIERAEQENFDLIISDVMMPHVNGIELCRRLRAQSKFRATPILLLSSELKDTPSAIAGMEAGADDYVELPSDPLRLIAKVTRLIEQKQTERVLLKARDELALKVAERTVELSTANDVLKQEIAERNLTERALRASEEKYRSLVANIPDVMWSADSSGNLHFISPNVERVYGFTAGELYEGAADLWFGRIHPDDIKHVKEAYESLFSQHCMFDVEYRIQRKDGQWIWFHDKAVATYEKAGVLYTDGTFSDITDRKMLEGQLRQAQKLESIGQLAAGIAHEINTPTQYVGDNTRFLQDAFLDLMGVMEVYGRLHEVCRAEQVKLELLAELDTTLKEADLEYLTGQIPRAIQQSLEGIERISRIVSSMKDFAHPGSKEKKAIDMNRAIESTITVARNEWKYVAEMVTDFDPGLPPVPCLSGEFNQVILNMITNATHAIADVVGDGSRGKGKITIRTRNVEDEWAEITVSDTGTGISEDIQSQIFDPFFTTKEVGKGSGQGLAISRTVIVEQHGGTLTLETEDRQGATFTIRLPINNGEHAPEPAAENVL
jgi:PAS domain S-box-containing protein